MNIVLLSDRGQASIVEKPDEKFRAANRAEVDTTAGTVAVDVFVEAVVKQILSIASASVRGANPNRAGQGYLIIGSPGQRGVGRDTDGKWELDIPAFRD